MITTLALGSALKAFFGFVFDNPLGKAAAAVTVLLTAFSIWLWQHDNKVAAAAKTEIVADINAKTEALTNEGLKAREGANPVGAWDRLRQSRCRDCD